MTLAGSGSDPDGRVDGYAWTQTAGPTVALSGASSATATFTAPAVTERTTLSFLLTVTDDAGATDSDEVSVYVWPQATNNLPPVADAGTDQTVASGAAVTLTGSGSDTDGWVNSYEWTQIAGPTVVLSDAWSVAATFTAPAVTEPTTLTFLLTVTDDEGAFGIDDVRVTVSLDAGSDEGTVTPCEGDMPVNIPDAALRAALLDELGKHTGDAVTCSDMAGLTRLVAVGEGAFIPFASAPGIVDLTGLEFATNLTVLFLGYNSISDVSSLGTLTSLTDLSLQNNSISDISALSTLTSLTFLGLSENSISDVSALSALTSPTTLWIANNSISNVSALGDLTSLTNLILSNNSISDISALSALTSLTTLWISSNSISNVPALSALTSLTSLILDHNSISDARPLVDNAGLDNGDLLRISRNPLTADSVNTHIPALRARGVIVICSLADGTSC